MVNSGRMPSDQSIAQPLMVAFRVIMLHEFTHRAAQRRLPDENHPIQTFFFDRANEALGISVQIRRHRRQPDHLGPRLAHNSSKLVGVLTVSVDDQVALPA
jgi:hypothetical protein